MFENLVPQAFAQAANVAAKAAKAKTAPLSGGGASAGDGLGNLFQYVISHLDNWIGGIFIIVVAYILANNAAKAAKERILRNKGEEISENVLILVERMTKIGILAIGIVIAGSINGIHLGTVLGAISLAIGFAIKDIIGNFISSIVMLAQNRMRIGDFIQMGDIMGTIVSIDTRVTILQALDGSQIVIPNQTMLNTTVVSYSINPFRRIQIDVGVDYNTDLPMVTSLVKGILDKHPDVVPKPASTVLVSEFGNSSIILTVFFWIESTKNWQSIRSNISYRIKKAFNEVGVNIPFPIRTLKLDEDDRAFLKTMESLKKGAVPGAKVIPAEEVLRKAAQDTEHAPTLPLKLFDKEKEVKDAAFAKETSAPPPSINLQPAVVPANANPPSHL